MQLTMTMPTVHQTKRLTGRKSAKMTWAVLLLQDTETLQTYEEYARESAYEADGKQPPHTHTLTPLPAGTNTKKPNPLARGEPTSHTTANHGPPLKLPAWK